MKSWQEMKKYLIDNNIKHQYNREAEIIDIENGYLLKQEQLDEIFSWDGFYPDDVQVEIFGLTICINLVGA